MVYLTVEPAFDVRVWPVLGAVTESRIDLVGFYSGPPPVPVLFIPSPLVALPVRAPW